MPYGAPVTAFIAVADDYVPVALAYCFATGLSWVISEWRAECYKERYLSQLKKLVEK